MNWRLAQSAARSGAWTCLFLASCVASTPSYEERVAERYAAVQAEGTLEAYENFVEDVPRSAHTAEAQQRVIELRWEQARTGAERCAAALAFPEAPETRAALPALLDDLLARREFRRLNWLTGAIPAVAADPRVVAALDLSEYDEETRDRLRALIVETRSLQLAWAASALKNTHETRVLPYLLDALRHAPGYQDLQEVEITYWQTGRSEKLKGKTSASAEVWSTIYWIVGPLNPARDRDELLLTYAADDSEKVRKKVRRYFDGRNETHIWRLENEQLSKVTDLAYTDFRINPWVVDDLVRCVTSAVHPYGRNYAVLTLGVNRVEKARTALIEALADGEPVVRRSAVASLAALGDSANELRPMLADPVHAVVATTAEALGLLGDAGSTEALVPHLRHADPHVRSAAAIALEQLGWRPTTDEQRARWLYAAEDWSRFRDLPEGARRAALLPDQDAYVAWGCADLREDDGTRRSPEQLAAWIDRLQEQAPSELIVAASWLRRDPPDAVLDRTWRDLLLEHRGVRAVRRWPIEWMTARVRRGAEENPGLTIQPNLGSRLVDRRLALVPVADGLRIVPGSTYFTASIRVDALELLDCDGPIDDVLAPSLERRIRFDLDRARAGAPAMEASVLLLLTPSLTLDEELMVWICRDCALEEAREQRWGESSGVAKVRNYRQPPYIFYDEDDYRWASGSPRELAEARGDSLEDRYAVRLVTTPVGGTVREVDEEAVIRLEDAAGTTHEISGLIATHMRVGDRVFPGDCVGIGPRD